jgi:DNA-binding transcriptional MerR regulator
MQVGIPEDVLKKLEAKHADGISSNEILEVFEAHDLKFSEATLRKYVQVGLLPRSVRVGRKGKHQGSQGMYPVSIVRQILAIKEMMAQNFTIEEIQKQFLFVRGDIEELERRLDKIFGTLKHAATHHRSEPVMRIVSEEIGEAEELSHRLVDKLGALESRFISQARVARRIAV